MSALRLLSKVIGLGAIGISAYDIFSETSRKGNNYVKYTGAKRAQDCFLRTSTNVTNSATANKFQNWLRDKSLNGSLYRIYDKIKGYSLSVTESVSNRLDNLGLGALAVLGTGKGVLGKIPLLGVASAGVLAAKGINFVLESLGIGNIKNN